MYMEKTPKKIILDFEGKYSCPDKESTVISNSITTKAKNLRLVSNSSYPESKFAQEFSVNWKEIYTATESRDLKLLLKSTESFFYRNTIIPIMKWISTLDAELSSGSIKEIEFLQYYESERVFTYEAEGEISKQQLYKSSYFLPRLIRFYLERKYPDIKLIIRYRNHLVPKTKFYVRNVLYVACCTFYNIYLRFLAMFKDKVQQLSLTDNILVVRSPVQAEFIHGMCKSDKNRYTVIASAQILKHKKLSIYLKENSIKHTDATGSIGIFSLMKSAILTLSKLCSVKEYPTLRLLDGNLDLPLKYVIKDLYCRQLDYLIFSESVSSFIIDSPNIKNIYSFDMFTPHAHYLMSRDDQHLYQVQTTLISPKPEVEFIAKDGFIFTSKYSYEKFLEINEEKAKKVQLLPNLKYVGISEKSNLKDRVETITYFTQPYDFEDEIELLDFLSSYCAKNDIYLRIKYHPRQAVYEFDLDNVEVINQTTLFSDIVDSSDLIVTRKSSIGMDCWVHKVPVIFFRRTPDSKNVEADYLPSEYVGDISSFDELEFLIANYAILKKSFNMISFKPEFSAPGVGL